MKAAQMASLEHMTGDVYRVGCDIERELNATNAEIERLTNKVAQLYEGAEEAKQRIKRLEEAGDALYEHSYPIMWDSPEAAARKRVLQLDWNKAKEAK
jgi:chromosome segregation ATPase